MHKSLQIKPLPGPLVEYRKIPSVHSSNVDILYPYHFLTIFFQRSIFDNKIKIYTLCACADRAQPIAVDPVFFRSFHSFFLIFLFFHTCLSTFRSCALSEHIGGESYFSSSSDSMAGLFPPGDQLITRRPSHKERLENAICLRTHGCTTTCVAYTWPQTVGADWEHTESGKRAVLVNKVV